MLAAASGTVGLSAVGDEANGEQGHAGPARSTGEW